jgi:GTP-binding protein
VCACCLNCSHAVTCTASHHTPRAPLLRITFTIATRGLVGLRNQLLTATRGMGIVNTIFDEYRPVAGEIMNRDQGSLVAFETGQVTAYALETAQERGLLFVR